MSLAFAACAHGVYAPAQDRALGAEGAELRASLQEALAAPDPRNRLAEMLKRLGNALRKGTEKEGVLVSAGAFGRAYEVLSALPSEIPLPDVVIESSEEIGLDWHNGERRVLSLTVDRSAFIGFAALIGRESTYGRTPFAGSIPRTVSDLLRRVHPSPSRLRSGR